MEFRTAAMALGDLVSATFVGIDTLTNVPLKGGKKNLLQGKVQKRVLGSNVMAFANGRSNAYDNMVKRRLEKEGKDPASFVLSPRAWGERISGTCFVTHKGKMYVEFIFLKPGCVQYLVDGKVTPKEKIEGLEDRVDSPEGQGGLDNRVIIRTYLLDSITCMRVAGQEYR